MSFSVLIAGQRGSGLMNERKPAMSFEAAATRASQSIGAGEVVVCQSCGREIDNWFNRAYLLRWGYCGSSMCIGKGAKV